MPEYLNEAANVIKKAIECESEERFDESVACYRKAIGTLLESIPKDKCLKRQASVKRRIAQYITKAEQLSKMVEVSSKFSNIGFPHLDYFNDVQDLKRYKMQQILGKTAHKWINFTKLLSHFSRKNCVKSTISSLQ